MDRLFRSASQAPCLSNVMPDRNDHDSAYTQISAYAALEKKLTPTEVIRRLEN